MPTPTGQRHPLQTPRTHVVTLYATLTGGGAADMVNADSAANGGGEIVSAVRTGTGAYTLTLRKQWPAAVSTFSASFLDATNSAIAGFDVATLTMNLTANPPTATVVFNASTTPTDVATTTTVYLNWTVRSVNKD